MDYFLIFFNKYIGRNKGVREKKTHTLKGTLRHSNRSQCMNFISC